jgi:anti-sigma-K factor RskA
VNDDAPGARDELEELLGAYVLDAVDDEERARVDALLATDAAARAEVAALRDVVALLAPEEHGDGFAQRAVWASIERAIEDAPQLDLDAAVHARPPARSVRLPVAAAVLVAVAAAGVVGGLLAANGRDGDDGVLDVAEAANAALGEPGTARVQLVGARGERVGTVVVTDDGTGFFLDPALDPLAPGRTYQLWALAGSSRPPVSVAVLGPDARPATFRVSGDVRAFAVSVEDAPGAAEPTLPPAAQGEIT